MRKTFIILFLLITSLVGATDYYVKTGGNDAAAGTSDGTAWARHPWMSTWTGSVTLAAGDIVYMNRGDTWTKAGGPYLTVAQNGSTGNHITTTAYGTGAKPKLASSSTSYAAVGVIHAVAKSYITFDNLEIQNYSSTYGSEMGISMIESGTDPCHDITITNCVIHEIPQYPKL